MIEQYVLLYMSIMFRTDSKDPEMTTSSDVDDFRSNTTSRSLKTLTFGFSTHLFLLFFRSQGQIRKKKGKEN